MDALPSRAKTIETQRGGPQARVITNLPHRKQSLSSHINKENEMAIISNFSVRNPSNIEMTMSTTMTVKEWSELASNISEGKDYWSTSNAFLRSIKELVDKAQKEFQAYEISDDA